MVLLKFLFALIILFQDEVFTDSDFQQAIDGFVESFDELIPPENSQTSTEGISYEGIKSANEPFIEKETAQLLGDEYEFNITSNNILEKAEQELKKINVDLVLVNVSRVTGQVTNDVIQTMHLVVAHKNCSEESCQYSCKIELHSRNNEEVAENTCAVNLDKRDKRDVHTSIKKKMSPEEAKVLANFAVNTLDLFDVDNDKRIVKEILSATKELSEGVFYNLVLRVGIVNCKESSIPESCYDILEGSEKLCRVKLYQSFENNSTYKLTQSDCTPISATNTKFVKADKRVRREEGRKQPLLGGYQPADVNSEDVKRLANFSTLELAKQENCKNCVQLDKILKAETQVVAGINMRIKLQIKNTETNELQECNVVVYEKSWENVRELTSFRCKKMDDKRVRREEGRKQPLLGGYQPADVNSEDVKRLANFSTLELAKQENCENCIQLNKILKAETQVVAGVNVRMKLQIKNTGTNELQECNVVVYEKSWENVRELTSFRCKKMDDKRVRREEGRKQPLLGGYQPADVNSEDVKRLANFSTLELAKQENCENCIQLDKILKAETQVVAGINMRMKLQIKNTGTNELQECNVVVYEKSWENVRELTSFRCKKMDDKRVRREEGRKQPLLGGYQPADVNSEDVKRLANFSTLELAKQENCENCIQLDKILKAETQVVAGVNMRMKLQIKNTGTNELQECNVVVYEKSWENVRELTSFRCKKMDDKRVRREEGRKQPLLGGYQPADVNSEDVKRLANFSTLELAKQENCENCIQLDKILKAETQVVAGINMRMKLQIKNTGTNELQECNVVVYEKSWENVRELTSFRCKKMDDKRVRREEGRKQPLLGGYQPADVNSEDVKRLANFSTVELAKQENCKNCIQLDKIIKAETQVVAGVNMRMKLQIKNTGTNELQECNVVVYERSWENFRELTSFRCKKMHDKSVRREEGTKKPLPGGYQPADINSEDVKRLANFSTVELAKQENCKNCIQLDKILKAETQVVAGVNMRMKLQLKNTGTNALQECNVVVYERSWENVRELTSFSCKKMGDKRVRREQKGKKHVVGGYKPEDVNSEVVQRLANFSTLELAKQVNCRDCIKLDKVIKAETQVVGGINVRMKIQLRNTATNELQQCNVVVYERSWENFRDLKSYNCIKLATKRIRREQGSKKHVVGGYKLADVNSEVVQRLANFSTLELANQVNCKNCIQLEKVVKAETQVVSGINVRMKLQLKNSDTDETFQCDAIVWEKVWENFRQLQSLKCNNESKTQLN